MGVLLMLCRDSQCRVCPLTSSTPPVYAKRTPVYLPRDQIPYFFSQITLRPKTDGVAQSVAVLALRNSAPLRSALPLNSLTGNTVSGTFLFSE